MAQSRQVTSDIYPFLTIRLDLRGRRHETSGLLDTGFSGDLAIPTGFFDGDFGLPDGRIDWELADGSTIDAPVYLGSVEIAGFPPVPAAITVLGDEYILGRGVIDRYKVTFDHGQRLIVEL